MGLLQRLLKRSQDVTRGRGPRVVAFDALGTLVDLEPLRGALGEVELPESDLEPWLARTLREGFASEEAGRFVPFAEVAASTLESLRAERGLPPAPAAAKKLVERMRTLPLFADVAPSLARLHEAGIRVAVVTNGSQGASRAVLARGGVSEVVDAIVSIEDVRRWRPAPAVYEEIARATGVAPGDVLYVGDHAADLEGARRAGVETARVSRSAAPDDRAGRACPSIAALVDRLLGPPPAAEMRSAATQTESVTRAAPAK